MATIPHCLYCFEALSSTLLRRDALTLSEVEDSWIRYGEDAPLEGETGSDLPVLNVPILPAVSRLRASSPSSASTSSTPSTLSTTSSSSALGDSKSSSKTSLFSFGRHTEPGPLRTYEEHPLFITWNTVNSRGHKTLRGCIGTFEPQALESGLRSYAMTSAFEDTRFSPITKYELNHLSVTVTLLLNFTPCADPMDWEVGKHGLRLSFTDHGKRYSSTYLPDVAAEQGWTKEDTIRSLMRKAGYGGRTIDYKKINDLKCVRYEGKKASVEYSVWKEWRAWVDKQA